MDALVGQSFEAIIEGLKPGVAGQLTVGIIRADGTVVVAQSSVGIAEIDAPSGNYAAALQSPQVGDFLIEWVDASVTPIAKYVEDLHVAQEPAALNEVYPSYPDSATLIANSTVAELTSLPGEQLDTLRVQAIQAVEEYCQQSFELAAATKQVDGSGSDEQWLPARLESFTAISARGAWWPGGWWSDEFAEVSIETITLSDDHFRLMLSQVVPNYAVQAMDWGDQPYRRVFPPGPGSIEITGEWGWPTIPSPVIQAIRTDMEDTALADANQLSGTIRAYRKLGLTQIRQGNLSGVLGASEMPLSIAAQRLLRPYVMGGQIGSMA